MLKFKPCSRCEECGKPLRSKRDDQIYCSNCGNVIFKEKNRRKVVGEILEVPRQIMLRGNKVRVGPAL